jgi:dienelactone hydrolase
MHREILGCLLCAVTILLQQKASAQDAVDAALPGTQLLADLPEDPAASMVAGIDRFALRHIEIAKNNRAKHWEQPDSQRTNLRFLKTCLGLPEQRESFAPNSFLVEPTRVYSDATRNIRAIRWPVLNHPAPQLSNAVSLWGEGLLIQPLEARAGSVSTSVAIVLADADELPEAYAGILENDRTSVQKQIVEALLGRGITVVVPQLVSRKVEQHGNANLSRREYLHRAAFELGHTLVGYEVQSVQALLDQFPADQTIVCGFGEGGMLAMYSGAVDERIDTTLCCGYFGPRENSWQAPLSRNIFGLLARFGDAELGAMIAPRKLLISVEPSFAVSINASGGAPAEWKSPGHAEVEAEFERLQAFAAQHTFDDGHFAKLIDLSEDAAKSVDEISGVLGDTSARLGNSVSPASNAEELTMRAQEREGRVIASIDAYTQAFLSECEYRRQSYLNIGLDRNNAADGANGVDTSSEDRYMASIERFRTQFIEQVIGKFDVPLRPLSPKSKRNYAGKNWTGYDVVLDVFEDVFAYGVLLVPNDIQPGERRPVVVCQHGLEGRPQDTILGDHYAYHDFSAALAERGFIVFAPQNPYIGKDDFRTLQRKLNPLGKSLFSVIGPQHAQILTWLSSLPNVDPQRIAFYGLSYGGKSAMRLPAMLPQYCLSICSADFNDWVWKNASSRSSYSYVGTGEYEIFEFNLGQTFNYAEMAALIAPRPFMVERGHFDGVAPDDRVAKEFARVRFLYAARLGLPKRCEIEWFNGPHTIHGQGTFEFLHRHLDWPRSPAIGH